MRESRPRREPKPPGPHFVGKPRNPVREFFLFVLLALCLALLLRQYVFTVTTVSGRSMQPILLDGQHLLVDRLTTRWHLPRAGDIVALRDPQDPSRSLVKRVVALPGQQVGITNGTLNVDGKPIVERYIAEPMDRDVPVVTVPPGSIYVLGDNRNNSQDSRAFGPAPQANLLGRVLLRFWPPQIFSLPAVWGGHSVR